MTLPKRGSRTKRWLLLTLGLLVSGCASVIAVPILLLGLLDDSLSNGCGSGLEAPAGAAVAPVNPGALVAVQARNARIIVAVGEQMSVPEQGIVVALATASQESGFRMLANDGSDPRLKPEQKDVYRSLQYPNDGVGRDHGSVNFFQQQYPWWGSLDELMNPQIASVKFYTALLKVPGWQAMPVTVAAQTVQGSQFPDAYADDEVLARQIYATNRGAGAGAPPLPDRPTPTSDSRTDPGCAADSAQHRGAGVRLPVDPGHYTISSGFGPRDGTFHAGVDFAAPPGTPIYAVTGGKVTAAGDAHDGYGNCVHISDGNTETLYAHQIDGGIKVKPGDTVTAGALIGAVGSTGDSTGPHLHYEVRINGRATNPIPYLTGLGLHPEASS